MPPVIRMNAAFPWFLNFPRMADSTRTGYEGSG
jgi:hypothetical protein